MTIKVIAIEKYDRVSGKKFSELGKVIYCVTTDQIYNHADKLRIESEADIVILRKNNHHIIEIPSFYYAVSLTCLGKIISRETLMRDLSLCKPLNEKEKLAAENALIRLQNEQLAAISYPWLDLSCQDAPRLEPFFKAGSPGVHTMVPASPDAGPEQLPGPPVPMRWVNGSGIVPASMAPPLQYVVPEQHRPGPMAEFERGREARGRAGVLGRKIGP